MFLLFDTFISHIMVNGYRLLLFLRLLNKTQHYESLDVKSSLRFELFEKPLDHFSLAHCQLEGRALQGGEAPVVPDRGVRPGPQQQLEDENVPGDHGEVEGGLPRLVPQVQHQVLGRGQLQQHLDSCQAGPAASENNRVI